MKQKLITVKIQNKQLDALEDLLFCELSKTEKEKAIKDAKKLWQVLVEAFDE